MHQRNTSRVHWIISCGICILQMQIASASPVTASTKVPTTRTDFPSSILTSFYSDNTTDFVVTYTSVDSRTTQGNEPDYSTLAALDATPLVTDKHNVSTAHVTTTPVYVQMASSVGESTSTTSTPEASITPEESSTPLITSTTTTTFSTPETTITPEESSTPLITSTTTTPFSTPEASIPPEETSTPLITSTTTTTFSNPETTIPPEESSTPPITSTITTPFSTPETTIPPEKSSTPLITSTTTTPFSTPETTIPPEESSTPPITSTTTTTFSTTEVSSTSETTPSTECASSTTTTKWPKKKCVIDDPAFLYQLRQELINDVGYKDKIYEGPNGIPTFGIGHQIIREDPEFGKPFGTKVSVKRIEKAFKADVKEAIKSCCKLFKKFQNLPKEVQLIILNMRFNLGHTGLEGFEKFREAVNRRNWVKAANEMKNSEWYKQVPNRAKRLVKRMKNVEKNC